MCVCMMCVCVCVCACTCVSLYSVYNVVALTLKSISYWLILVESDVGTACMVTSTRFSLFSRGFDYRMPILMIISKFSDVDFIVL